MKLPRLLATLACVCELTMYAALTLSLAAAVVIGICAACDACPLGVLAVCAACVALFLAQMGCSALADALAERKNTTEG